jgi:hypothetical protein
LGIFDKLKSAWNAFKYTDNNLYRADLGTVSYSGKPDRQKLKFFNERTIITSIFARIDIVMTMFDKGCAALVPVDTTLNPNTNEVVDIFTLRVGEITKWYPKHVTVNAYNEANGQRQEVTLEKRFVAIVENPLYAVMNEPNSTLQRLIRKLSMMDSVDEQASSGKLDMIIQLPYVIKTEARRNQAEQRRKDIEFQLKGSQYGIAYTDGTEKITQLNRPLKTTSVADRVSH